jgi:hypothetical protein
MWAKWIGIGPVAAMLSAATGVAVLAAAGFVFSRRRGVQFPEGLEAALLLMCIPLLSPQGWDYVFLVATPAVVFVLNYFGALSRHVQVASTAALLLIGFTLYDVMGRAAYSMFMMLSVITVCFLVIAGALVIVRTRAVA